MRYLVLPAAVARNLLVMACQTQKTLTAAGPALAAAPVNRVANQFSPETP